MPGVEAILEHDEEVRRERSQPLPPVEDTNLYLPSAFGAMDNNQRKLVCPLSLFDKEAAIRRGQCGDALERAAVKESEDKYRRGWKALRDIVGVEKCGLFRELLEEDVELPDLIDPDDNAVKALGRLGGAGGRVTGTMEKSQKKVNQRRNAPGETRALMSWIWTSGSGLEDNEYVHQYVHIEWAKALARKTR
ncbi:hypothetical protein BDZ89DRAFT_1149648 [Hymenopellis radicata]|nr:hypothetical protein BDZ89DRAFT_1149648 [Hymenopellis radicata]